MEIFISIIIKILPLYILIGFGYLAAKLYKVETKSISNLLVYIIAPAVVFLGTVEADLSFGFVIIPVVFYLIPTIISLTMYKIGGYIWKDSTKSIAAVASAAGNGGFFGLPFCLAILGSESLPIVVMVILGISTFQNTIGYYLFSKSTMSAKGALKALMRMPAIYAFLIGITLNLLHISIPGVIIETANLLKSGYVLLGMMILGLGLAEIKMLQIDKKLIFITLFNKFVVWLIIGLFIIFIDKNYLHLLNDLIYKVIIIQSIVPIANSTVAFASIFKTNPDKAALVVFISTIIALIYIPFILTILNIL